MKNGPNLKMVDLHGQYKAIEEEILQAMKEVMESSAFINGPAVKKFSDELAAYTESKHVIPCGNGTDALQIALMALDLQPGDEVIVPAFTYVATVEVISLLKLQPVFVDVDPDTFNMDMEKFENIVSAKTKAIIVVHLFGQCADMEEFQRISEKYHIPVIEDNAQALGAAYTFSNGEVKRSGIMGTIGTTSFFPSKNLGTFGDGGALFAQEDNLAEKIRMVANHGQKRKYYHDIVGVNSRLDSLHAAILSVKLKYLDDYARKRQEVAKFYDDQLSLVEGLILPKRSPHSTHVFHQYTLKLKSGVRDKFREFLKSHGIPSMVYYPLPQHLQKAYLGYGFMQGDFPVSEKLCEEVCSIPIHTEMTEVQLEYIISIIKRF